MDLAEDGLLMTPQGALVEASYHDQHGVEGSSFITTAWVCE